MFNNMLYLVTIYVAYNFITKSIYPFSVFQKKLVWLHVETRTTIFANKTFKYISLKDIFCIVIDQNLFAIYS